ncbi:MAG: hypothetical protein V2A71_02690 [Candidatus Eisenbacteria bacterium]
MKTRCVLILVLAVLVSGLLVLCGCDKRRPDDRVKNTLPSVKVSGGPPQGGIGTYSVPIYWFGWDSDGVVEYFLYAIDDTTQWTETRYFQGSFLFTADSVRSGEEFGGWHTFWIKAVDNDGAHSKLDYLTFDARTVAPRTTIRSPRCVTDPTGGLFCQGAVGVGLSVKIVWEGDDPDSRDPRREPVGYRWRLMNVNTYCQCEFPPFPPDPLAIRWLQEALRQPDYFPDSTSFWSAPTTQTEIVFRNLTAGTFWLFGLRAIDEAGAVEPALILDRNLLYFTTAAGYGVPTLDICEGSSCHNWPAGEAVWQREVPAGRPLSFRWSGSADFYGGTISGYSYGVDIEDLNDPEQWEVGWSLEVTSATVTFDKPGVHYFYVKVKDYADIEQLGIVELEVVEFLFDRDILLVDDFFDSWPRDIDHDQYLDRILTRCRDYTDSVYVFTVFPPAVVGTARETFQRWAPPTLSELTRYKFVIWDTDARQNSFDTGWNRDVLNGILDVYLKGGGRLWVYGLEIVRGSYPNPGENPYPITPLDGTFAYRHLRVSGTVNVATSASGPIDGFMRAVPNRKISNEMPTLEVASQWSTPMQSIEAVLTAMQDPMREQRPDTLCFYVAARPTSSTFHNKACGFRFYDRYSGSKLVYMGLPIHYFVESKAESLATFVTDWMFADMPTTGRALVRR